MFLNRSEFEITFKISLKIVWNCEILMETHFFLKSCKSNKLNSVDLCSSLTWVYLLNVTSLGVDPKSSFYLVSPGWSRNIQKVMCLRIVFWNFHGPEKGTIYKKKIYLAEQCPEYSRNLFSICLLFNSVILTFWPRTAI